MDDEVELDSGIIAVGGTQPPLVPGLGIPWWDMCIICMAAGESLMLRWELLIVIIPLFFWLLKLYAKDYNAGRCLLCYCSTSALHFSDVLGGTFMSPGRYDSYRGTLH